MSRSPSPLSGGGTVAQHPTLIGVADTANPPDPCSKDSSSNPFLVYSRLSFLHREKAAMHPVHFAQSGLVVYLIQGVGKEADRISRYAICFAAVDKMTTKYPNIPDIPGIPDIPDIFVP